MAEESLGVVAQASIAVIAVATVVVTSFKSINLGRHVRDTLKEQTTKIDTVVSKQSDIDKILPVYEERYGHIVEVCATLEAQNKEIFCILTEMRSDQIRELKARVQELEAR